MYPGNWTALGEWGAMDIGMGPLLILSFSLLSERQTAIFCLLLFWDCSGQRLH